MGLWPPVTKYKKVANRGLTQQNVGLFIHFTVSRMCAVYYIPEGRGVWKAWGGTLWWKMYCVKHVCWAAHLRGGHCVPRRKTLRGHPEVPASSLGIRGWQCWGLVHRVFITSGTRGKTGCSHSLHGLPIHTAGCRYEPPSSLLHLPPSLRTPMDGLLKALSLQL